MGIGNTGSSNAYVIDAGRPNLSQRSLYKRAWIVLLIVQTIAEMPFVSSKVLGVLLKSTKAILQKARMDAWQLIFGDLQKNIGYLCHFLERRPVEVGHFCLVVV